MRRQDVPVQRNGEVVCEGFIQMQITFGKKNPHHGLWRRSTGPDTGVLFLFQGERLVSVLPGPF